LAKEKGESGENLPAGRGEENPKNFLFFPLPFFPSCLPAGRFAFVTQESKPNTMDMSTEKWVTSKTAIILDF
jgi:hypothetical protein